MKRTFVPMCLAALVLGCGGAKLDSQNGAGKAGRDGAGSGQLGRTDAGSRCEAGAGRREVLVDLNQDNKPDVRKVYLALKDDEVVVCREADLNFDGVKDLFVFFDDKGQTTRDEVDFDKDGKIDVISTYANGQVVKQEIDTNSDGLVDRVRYLENAVPVRVEGDQDGDRRVDLWEYYEGGKLVRIGTDTDGDGKADEWSRDDETEQAVLSEQGGGDTDTSTDTEAKAAGAAAKDTALGTEPKGAAADQEPGATGTKSKAKDKDKAGAKDKKAKSQ